MAVPQSLHSLVESLTSSLQSTVEATPKLSGIEPSETGLSLLDVKNEILLSYVQNLVFLILLRIRHSKNTGRAASTELRDTVVQKLVELRLYLDRGVRPLEGKLRYQIERALQAAEDADRKSHAKAVMEKAEAASNDSDSPEQDSDGESDTSSLGDKDRRQRTKTIPSATSDGSQHGPKFGSLVKRTTDANDVSENVEGVYRPPKIRPTVMPSTDRRDRAERRPMKSATIDEFIADELSTAPVAEPSIGANIRAGGRHMKTASERQKDAEQQDYEERNFMRLPKESKKDRAVKARQQGGRIAFGGEDWRDLGEGIDRINRLTRTKETGAGTRALLDKSRKRGFDTTDRPRGSGASGMGERYQKRLKTMDKGRQDKGRKRAN